MPGFPKKRTGHRSSVKNFGLTITRFNDCIRLRRTRRFNGLTKKTFPIPRATFPEKMHRSSVIGHPSRLFNPDMDFLSSPFGFRRKSHSGLRFAQLFNPSTFQQKYHIYRFPFHRRRLPRLRFPLLISKRRSLAMTAAVIGHRSSAKKFGLTIARLHDCTI